MKINKIHLKPSAALEAMVRGLKASEDDLDLVVDVGTFGMIEEGVCLACPATIALINLIGDGKSASQFMLEYADLIGAPISGYWGALSVVSAVARNYMNDQDLFYGDNLEELEWTLDEARKGYPSYLIKLLEDEYIASFDNRWRLRSDNWEEQLPEIEQAISEMKEQGL